MLEKVLLDNRNVRVTFRMPPMEGVVELYLCGEFNEWRASGIPFRQEPDGSWVATLDLEAGKSYRFRYHDNQGRWHNDWEADSYVPNSFGSEDSVVDLVFPTSSASREHPKQGREGGPGRRTSSSAPRSSGASAKPRRGRSRRGKQGGGGRGRPGA